MPRKLRSQDSNPYDSVRGMWEGAYVSQFLRLFQYKFDFIAVTTQEFEDSLVDNDSLLAADICARLLRYLTGTADALISNFEQHLKQLVSDSHITGSPIHESSTSWAELSPEEKLHLLKWLIDHVHQEKEEDLMEYLEDNYCADDMRGICAGQDAFNNVYWYLDDLRLYRENTVKKPNKKVWECVCFTYSDWQSFLKQFRKTSNPQERELYSYLNDELFPLIESQLQIIGDKDYKNIELDNNKLLKREAVLLGKMIKENKGKKEMNTNPAIIKSEPEVELTPPTCKEEVSEPVVFEGSETKPKIMESETVNGPIVGPSVQPSGGPSSNSTSSGPPGNCPVSTVAPTVGLVNPIGNKNGGMHMHQEGPTPELNEVPIEEPCRPPKEEILTPGPDGKVDVKPPMVVNPCPMPNPSAMPCAPMQPVPGPTIINKQPSTMEAQYMQQQSQIFVFSTQLANKAAEAVIQSQFPSIIAYHCSQPATKRFLEKHPLKVQQFHRQNPAAWLNNLVQMKQNRVPGPMKGNHVQNAMFSDHHFGPGPGPNPNWPLGQQPNMVPNNWPMGQGPMMNHSAGSPMCNPMGGAINTSSGNPMSMPGNSPMGSQMCHPMSSSAGSPICNSMASGSGSGGPMGGAQQPYPMMGGPGQPQQQQHPQHHHQHQHQGPPHQHPQQQQHPPHSQAQQQFCMMGGPHGPNSGSPMMNLMNSHQQSLAGVKVPDENLTPQQRQHREEQLAIIRNMHQLLFPDQHHSPNMASGPIDSALMAQTMMAQQEAMMGGGPGVMMGGQQGMMMSPQGPGGGSMGSMSAMNSPSGMSMMYSPSPGSGVMSPGSQPGPGQSFAQSSMMMQQQQQQQQQQRMMPQYSSPQPMAAQMEWQKLQQQFYDDRRRKDPVPRGMMSASSQQQPSPMQMQQQQQQQQQPGPHNMHPGSMSGGVMSPAMPGYCGPGPGPNSGQHGPMSGVGSPNPRMQGPPPPYHQAQQPQQQQQPQPQQQQPTPPSQQQQRSSAQPMPSPSPTSSSPAAVSSTPGGGSMSLSSPRMSSGLASPADASRQFPLPGNPRLPHPSPGSIHSTPLNSPNPRPLVASNPGTPVSAPMPSPGLTRKPSQDMMQPSPASDFVNTPQPLQQPLTPQQPPSNQAQPGTPQPTVSQNTSPPQQTPAAQATPAQALGQSSQASGVTGTNIPVTQPQPVPAEGMFGRTLQSYAQSQQRQQGTTPQPSPSQPVPAMQGQPQQPLTPGVKEPNLMPVPSPQQIQYLNTFDGQELTIQKQPNTSIREPTVLSPGITSTTAENPQPTMNHVGAGGSEPSQQVPLQRCSGGVSSAPTTPHSAPMTPASSGPGTPCTLVHTPLSSGPGISCPMASGGPQASTTVSVTMSPMSSGPMMSTSASGPGSMMSSVSSSPTMMTGGPMSAGSMCDVSPRYPGPGQPQAGMDPLTRFPVPSPGGCVDGMMQQQQQRFGGPTSMPMESMSPQRYMGPRGPVSSMEMMHPRFSADTNMQMGRFPSPNPNFMQQSHVQQKMGGPGFGPLSPTKVGPDMAGFPGSQGPLTPLGSSGNPSPMPGQRLSHFDPISSMAQMSQSLGQGQAPTMMTNLTSMNMASMQVSSGPGSAGNGSQANVVNFQTSMQSMQGVQQGMANQAGPGNGGGGNQSTMMSQVAQNMAAGGPQTVNNTYVNATMSIQQLNIQNVTTSAYNPSVQVQPMNPHPPMMQQQQQQQQVPPGANTVSSSISMSPIMHSSVSPKTTNIGMVMGPAGPRGPQPFPTPVGAQRMMSVSPTPRASCGTMPYNGANIQVKASAPNTIQYLPARPQAPPNNPQRPPSLEFLQRFTSPLSSLDSKVPTHNLQYFPNNQQHQGMTMNMNMAAAQMNPMGAGMGPGMGMSPGPNPGMGHMGPGMGPMSRQPGPSAMMRGPGPQHPSHQMYGPGQPMPGEGPMYGGMPGPMMGGNGGPPQMFTNKGQMSPLGLSSEVAQPMGPSMGGSQPPGSFKQAQFMGPTTADPNYAQQFHNFQQQLYATNTRGTQMTSQANMTSGSFFAK